MVMGIVAQHFRPEFVNRIDVGCLEPGCSPAIDESLRPSWRAEPSSSAWLFV